MILQSAHVNSAVQVTLQQLTRDRCIINIMTASEKPYVPIADRPLLGVPEAAALCGLSEKAVYTAIKRGELLVCYVHSSTAHIRRRDLDDWISCLPERPQ